MTKSTHFSGAPLVGVTGTYYENLQDPRFELAAETAEAYQAVACGEARR